MPFTGAHRRDKRTQPEPDPAHVYRHHFIKNLKRIVRDRSHDGSSVSEQNVDALVALEAGLGRARPVPAGRYLPPHSSPRHCQWSARHCAMQLRSDPPAVRPFAVKSWAVARPIPPAPPVIMATLPVAPTVRLLMMPAVLNLAQSSRSAIQFPAACLAQRFMLEVDDLLRHGGEQARGASMTARGLDIVIEGVQEKHTCAPRPGRASKSAWTWAKVPSPAQPAGLQDAECQSDAAEAHAGTGLPSSAASCCKRGSPVSATSQRGYE